MKVAIIGAGIAGLTAAIALHKAKIPFVIYESTKSIQPVGAGIAIANNAMQVYRHLGIVEQLNQKGMRISTIQLTDFNLKVLNKTDLTPFENQFQLANIAIHRSELHRILIDNVGIENIALDKRLKSIVQHTDGLHELTFTDNSKALHEFVIGADGIRSQVRQMAFGDCPLRDAKQVCWRGVLDFDLPETYNNTALEGWGKGKRFGFVKLDAKQVYWYFLVDEDLYTANTNLKDLCTDCAPLVQNMIAQTSDSAIFVDKIYDLKPMQNWYSQKIGLIGDAAHATTPNLGQGACQAIEDVYILSKLIETHTLEDALKQLPQIRRTKAHAIVKDSWTLGQVAQLRNPVLIALRNGAFRLLPAFLKDKQMKTMFELQKI